MSTLAGLPAHPLFVHAAVVLVPLAALVLLAYAFWPAARVRLGAASPVLALVALVSAKLAEGAGEALERTARLEPGADLAALQRHAVMGERTVLAAAGVLLLALALYAVHGAAFAGLRGRFPVLSARWLRLGLAVVSVVVVAAGIYLVVTTGHSGAALVWGDVAGS